VLFSVIIPTFNRAAMLREALESVERQEFRDFEIIVVDDGSTEDLSPVKDDFRGRVTFVRQENAGPGAARNRGARMAVGEYLAFLDSDDVWFPWTLRTQFDCLSRAGYPSMLLGSGVWFSHAGEVETEEDQALAYRQYLDFFQSGKNVKLAGFAKWCEMGKTSIFFCAWELNVVSFLLRARTRLPIANTTRTRSMTSRGRSKGRCTWSIRNGPANILETRPDRRTVCRS
jgi:glycosyltransferase involved in cell wall biosynthesis